MVTDQKYQIKSCGHCLAPCPERDLHHAVLNQHSFQTTAECPGTWHFGVPKSCPNAMRPPWRKAFWCLGPPWSPRWNRHVDADPIAAKHVAPKKNIGMVCGDPHPRNIKWRNCCNCCLTNKYQVFLHPWSTQVQGSGSMVCAEASHNLFIETAFEYACEGIHFLSIGMVW